MTRIGYTMLGTNDLERAAAFYDALLGELGAERFIQQDSMPVTSEIRTATN